MISCESVKRTQLEPSRAKLLCGIASKATDIRTNHLNSKHLTVEIISNRSLQIDPFSSVVTSPVEAVFVRAKSCASGDNERTKTSGLQEEICCIGLEESEEDMNISLCDIAIVSGIQ